MKDSPAQRPPPVKDVLLPVPGAARHARNLIAEACARWQLPHLIGSASLVATEFVTNAVVHANTLIDIHISCGQHHLLILISDGNPIMPARPQGLPITAHLYPDLARGLILVDATADHWGCRRVTGGKTMWAALHSPPT